MESLSGKEDITNDSSREFLIYFNCSRTLALLFVFCIFLCLDISRRLKMYKSFLLPLSKICCCALILSLVMMLILPMLVDLTSGDSFLVFLLYFLSLLSIFLMTCIPLLSLNSSEIALILSLSAIFINTVDFLNLAHVEKITSTVESHQIT